MRLSFETRLCIAIISVAMAYILGHVFWTLVG